EFRREIRAYELLQSLGVPTLAWKKINEAAIALEDLNASPSLRLAVIEDMQDPDIARQLARWYKALHEAGSRLSQGELEGLYSEMDYFKKGELLKIAELTSSTGLPFWQFLDQKFEAVFEKLNALPSTLVYNDFYYVNMAVARDGKSAFMFDYNLLGRGLSAMDLQNVLASLGRNAGEAFLDAYGAVEAREILASRFICPLTTMVMALKRPSLPAWFDEEWQKLVSGEIEIAIRDFLET
ncbi:MAG: phosphotransferase, partial [Crenarchaeota archaeon]|nr:phosphotransferase [Thermoproteota archaeon]